MESTLLDPANLEGAKGKETRILGELLLSFPVFPLHVIIGWPTVPFRAWSLGCQWWCGQDTWREPYLAKESRNQPFGTSLEVWWFGTPDFHCKGTGLIPGWGTRSPQAMWCSWKKILKLKKKKESQGLPWWFSGKNSLVNAKYTASIPDPCQFPHVTEQVSPGATSTEHTGRNNWSPCTLKPMLPNMRNPHTTTRE